MTGSDRTDPAIGSGPEVVSSIFDVVAKAAPEVRDILPERRSHLDDENPSGETQLAADAYADDLLADRLTEIDGVGAYASEERQSVVDAGTGVAVAVDPLDGSSNLRSNNPMGTIVGIYDGALPTDGDDLLAAGYVLYGPVTTMMLAYGAETSGVPAEATVREELVTDQGDRDHLRDVALPEDPTVYGFGGRVPDWPADFERYAREIESELKLRYGGAMIADVSQVLTYGGIFAYPGLSSNPSGKLRMLFEGAPIGYIVEAAGGRSSDGRESLLDVTPETLHDRTPVYVGNRKLIDRLETAIS